MSVAQVFLRVRPLGLVLAQLVESFVRPRPNRRYYLRDLPDHLKRDIGMFDGRGNGENAFARCEEQAPGG